jgi:hypothetical protein
MLEYWPFLLLIAVFVGFSVYMARLLGTGSGGSNYLKLMEAQVVIMKEQADAQKLLAEELRLQTAAIERLASAVEDRNR